MPFPPVHTVAPHTPVLCPQPLELEAKLSGISGNAQLEELLLQAADEVELIEFYAAEKCWERAPDLRWKADLDADIQADIEREDAANAANSSA